MVHEALLAIWPNRHASFSDGKVKSENCAMAITHGGKKKPSDKDVIMKYWLMKSEPDVFSWADLVKAKKSGTFWEGVRNYQARNFMLNDMKIGDLAFFYHSSCERPGIYGVAEVIEAAQPDPTSWDKKSEYYDPKSTAENPRWFGVMIKAKLGLERPLELEQLRADQALADLLILRKGNRLSITPVEKKHWDLILNKDKKS